MYHDGLVLGPQIPILSYASSIIDTSSLSYQASPIPDNPADPDGPHLLLSALFQWVRSAASGAFVYEEEEDDRAVSLDESQKGEDHRHLVSDPVMGAELTARSTTSVVQCGHLATQEASTSQDVPANTYTLLFHQGASTGTRTCSDTTKKT